MEDFLRILFIVGIIIIGIVRESNKKANKKKAFEDLKPRDIQPRPIPQTTPNLNKSTPLSKEPLQKMNHTDMKDRLLNRFTPASKEPERTVVSETKQTGQKKDDKTNATLSDPEEVEQDFKIQSIEEARQAIILGEILQRKY